MQLVRAPVPREAVEPIAIRSATRAERASRAASESDAIRSAELRICASAGIAAAAAALSVLECLSAIHRQAPSASAASASVAASVAAGVLVGLWAPRRVILRRLATRYADSAPAEREANATEAPRVATPRAEPEFASSLTAALLLAAAVWVGVSLALLGGYESYRAWLTQRTVMPRDATVAALLMPACAGFALLGLFWSIVLVAFHGWYRTATAPHTRVARLWLGILLGAAIGAIAQARFASSAVAGVGAPLLALLAAACALLRPQRARSDSAMVLFGSRRHAPVWRRLCAPAACAAALGAALAEAASSGASVGASAAIALFACAAGLGMARAMLRRRVGYDLAPELSLIAAVVLATPLPASLGGLADRELRAALLGVTGAMSAVMSGRRVARECGSLQFALSCLGGAACAGLAMGFGIVGVAAAGSIAGLRLASVLVAGIGLTCLLAGAPRWFTRRAIVLAGACAGVVSAALFGYGDTPPVAVARPLDSPLIERLVAGDRSSLRCALGATGLPPGVLRADMVDLHADSAETLVVQASSAAGPLTIGEAQRLVRRWLSALKPGGRLVLDGALGSAGDALIVEVLRRRPESEVWRVELTSDAGTWSARVLGPGARAWLERHAAETAGHWSVAPWTREP